MVDELTITRIALGPVHRIQATRARLADHEPGLQHDAQRTSVRLI